MSNERYENVIIGSGEGGKYLAWHLGKSGQRTVVVERRWVGGSCPNVNCLPSKNEIHSAKVGYLAHHAAKFGIPAISVSSDIAAGSTTKAGDGRRPDRHAFRTRAELVMGETKFTAPKTIDVHLNDGGGSRTLTAERIFLNLGTHASIPSVPGLRETNPLTNIDLLKLDRLPEHLIVIGGGYVGLEFAQAYRRFGSKVTVIHNGSHLLTGQDPDVATEIHQIFTTEDINVLISSEIVSVRGLSGTGLNLIVRTPSGEKTIQASDILIATGRTPNTAGIGLELAGVELDRRGYIKVNDRLETTAQNVWAIGESAGSPQFTHISLDDFRIIRDNLAGGNRSTRDRLVPYCLFTDPQLAHVGLTETEAKRLGVTMRVAKLPVAAVLRTRTTGETRGFLKALIDANSNRILGLR